VQWPEGQFPSVSEIAAATPGFAGASPQAENGEARGAKGGEKRKFRRGIATLNTAKVIWFPGHLISRLREECRRHPRHFFDLPRARTRRDLTRVASTVSNLQRWSRIRRAIIFDKVKPSNEPLHVAASPRTFAVII
jgi:hypothetical protein